MKNFSFIVYFAAWAAEVFCVYRFMYKDKSLRWKTLTSTFFLLAGSAAMAATAPASAFGWLIMLALALSWVGDVTLGIKVFGMQGIVGIVFFMAAHFAYIAAFSKRLNALSGGSFFEIPQIIAWAILLAAGVAFLIKSKVKLGAVTVPVIIYAGVICCMTVKSAALGIRCFAAGSGGFAGFLLPVCLILGAAMFLVSDVGVCMVMFGGKKDLPLGKKKFSLDNFNLVTYYGAQMLFGAVILLNAFYRIA